MACAPKSQAASAVAALAHVESGNRAAAIGDGGRAKGKHQFHQVAWTETTNYRKAQGLKVWPYSAAVNSEVSDLYAASCLAMLQSRLTSIFRRPPTRQEIYAAYNVGLTGFKRRNYMVSSCPKTTRLAAEHFAQSFAM